jgi:hypothetical protein
MRTLVMACVAVLAVAGSAQAENWVQIDKTEHTTVYVDKDSGERAGGHVKFWLKYNMDAEHPIGIYGGKPIAGENIVGTTKFVELRSQIDADCAARTFTNPAVRFYDAKGTMVSNAIASLESKPMPPNSIVATGTGMFCPAP